MTSTFVIPGRFPSLNDYIRRCRHNKYAANLMKREEDQRVATAARAGRVPPVTEFPVRVEVTCYEPDHRRDWDGIANAAVGSLRAEAGRDPYDRDLSDLVGELSTRSEQFRVRWAAHDVKYYRSGVQPFHHPLVGDLDLNYDALEIAAEPGLTIVAYTAEPHSPSQQALDLLASWTPTTPRAQPDSAGEQAGP